MDLGSGSSPQKALCLKPRPSRYAATCGRASWSATCRRAARRGPPGRPVVSGCQWHPSGLETVSNTRPCIGSFALVDEKSCVRTPQSLAQVLGGAGSTYACWACDPAQHSAPSRSSTLAPSARLRVTYRCVADGVQPSRAPQTRARLSSGAPDPRTRPRINHEVGDASWVALWGQRPRRNVGATYLDGPVRSRHGPQCAEEMTMPSTGATAAVSWPSWVLSPTAPSSDCRRCARPGRSAAGD